MRYTVDDLKKIRKKYNKNFDKLIKAKFGFPEHLTLVKEERRLNKLEHQIMNDLGINTIWKAVLEGKLK